MEKKKYGSAPPIRTHKYGKQVHVFNPIKRKLPEKRKLNWSVANIDDECSYFVDTNGGNEAAESDANENLTPASTSTIDYSSNDGSNDGSNEGSNY